MTNLKITYLTYIISLAFFSLIIFSCGDKKNTDKLSNSSNSVDVKKDNVVKKEEAKADLTKKQEPPKETKSENHSSGEPSPTIVFNNTQGKVTLKHINHGGANCDVCHGAGLFEKKFDDNASIKDLAHKICTDCHKAKNIPVSCNSCHKK